LGSDRLSKQDFSMFVHPIAFLLNLRRWISKFVQLL